MSAEILALVAAALAAAAVAMGLPPRAIPGGARPREAAGRRPPPVAQAAVRRHRLPLAAVAALAGPTLLPPAWGVLVGAGIAVLVWWAGSRVEPAAVRRAHDDVRRELPQVVRLLAVALAAGAPVDRAFEQVADALPGRTTDLLRLSRGRLGLGVPPPQVWDELAGEPGLEPLGRALARVHRSGGGVADAAHRLADELAREARLAVEDRARGVGIRAAVPLGACLLPAFLLLGIVPVVAAAAEGLGW